MSYRDRNPDRAIIEAVIQEQGSEWSRSTQDTARSDAQRILEALVAEVGIEGAVQALDRQGIAGYAYRYLLNPLYVAAMRRRTRANKAEPGAESTRGKDHDERG
ncbi:MAG: hypothetical protein FJ291_11425 [Planctomycetes bacterium]|nr:hypothetical protein [Planctomycetota bacterium]